MSHNNPVIRVSDHQTMPLVSVFIFQWRSPLSATPDLLSYKDYQHSILPANFEPHFPLVHTNCLDLARDHDFQYFSHPTETAFVAKLLFEPPLLRKASEYGVRGV